MYAAAPMKPTTTASTAVQTPSWPNRVNTTPNAPPIPARASNIAANSSGATSRPVSAGTPNRKKPSPVPHPPVARSTASAIVSTTA